MTALRAIPDDVSTARVFARTCAAEWTRLWTVWSTWWCLAAATVVMVGLGAIAGLDTDTGGIAWQAARISAVPAQFALLALALTAVTADHATGGIVPALQWTPRRGVLFLARTVVSVGVATALVVLLGLTASLTAAAAAGPVLELPLDEGLDSLGLVAVVIAAGAALAVGLGFALRSTAGGLVSVFLLLLVLPGLLPQLGHGWLTGAADRLPGTGVLFLLLGEPTGRGLTTTSAVLTMLAWAGGALLLGWLRLARTDAHR